MWQLDIAMHTVVEPLKIHRYTILRKTKMKNVFTAGIVKKFIKKIEKKKFIWKYVQLYKLIIAKIGNRTRKAYVIHALTKFSNSSQIAQTFSWQSPPGRLIDSTLI